MRQSSVTTSFKAKVKNHSEFVKIELDNSNAQLSLVVNLIWINKNIELRITKSLLEELSNRVVKIS